MRVALIVALVLFAPLSSAASEHLGRTLPQLLSDLESPREIDRLLAIRSVGEMAITGDSEATEALFGALEHSDGPVRYWAATAASVLTRPYHPGAQALRRALRDEVPEVRVLAALAEVRWGEEPEALATLGRLLSHPNRGVRLQAVHAADAIGDRAAPLADELRKALEDEFDYVQRVARHALWVLGERPCPYRSCAEEVAP